MVQHDIKRVLAYSTVSQLGYMFLACGVGAYAAGIFHLLTHAFFKALLFLAAGSVIHALSGEQDMRRMGGLWRRIPVTFWTMTVAVLAISGIPPFAGFFSKDEILYQTFVSPNPLGKVLWLAGLVTAGMTSFYMFRLWFKTFFGEPKFEHATLEHDGAPVHARSTNTLTLEADPDDDHATASHGVHESPWIMLFPLVVLAILSLVGGWVGVPAALGGHNEIEHFLDPVFGSGTAAAVASSGGHGLELGLAAISVLTAAGGFYLAFLWYWKKPGTAAKLASRTEPAYTVLANKYWVDEFYSHFLVIPLLMFSRGVLDFIVDRGIINGSGRAASMATRGFAWATRSQISGNIRSYAGWLAIGAAAVLAVMIFGRSLLVHL
jgi:NADH-quinone oxidoreductase subunit L